MDPLGCPVNQASAKIWCVVGFSLGIFADDIYNATRSFWRRSSEKAVVLTAEQIQKDFIEQRRKDMSSDDD